ncbi:MAG: aspartate 1-decarboxylase [Desulfovibrionaceae bacterium]|nr:aspartate 1-decarboxylase [Desulfovibrionaceae bacterium]
MLKILRAKLHGIHVTACDLNYHGSITLDPEILRQAHIYPLEFLYIWNKNTGERISTYVIPGIQGSRCCILNGAAARTCQEGDPLIIAAFEYLEKPSLLLERRPTILTFDADNQVVESLAYKIEAWEQNYTMSIEKNTP